MTKRTHQMGPILTLSKSKILLDPFQLTPRLMLGGLGLIHFWRKKTVFVVHPSVPGLRIFQALRVYFMKKDTRLGSVAGSKYWRKYSLSGFSPHIISRIQAGKIINQKFRCELWSKKWGISRNVQHCMQCDWYAKSADCRTFVLVFYLSSPTGALLGVAHFCQLKTTKTRLG